MTKDSMQMQNTYFSAVEGFRQFIRNSVRTKQDHFDILPTAKAGGFLHQPPLHSNRGCCVLHDVRQALLPVCPTVRYVLV